MTCRQEVTCTICGGQIQPYTIQPRLIRLPAGNRSQIAQIRDLSALKYLNHDAGIDYLDHGLPEVLTPSRTLGDKGDER